MATDFLISTLCTVVVSTALLWLAMRFFALRTFGLSNAIWASVIPLVALAPLEFAGGWFFPERLGVVFVVAGVVTIAVQAIVLQLMCRQQSATLPRWKAYLFSAIATIGSVLLGSPIAALILARIAA